MSGSIANRIAAALAAKNKQRRTARNKAAAAAAAAANAARNKKRSTIDPLLEWKEWKPKGGKRSTRRRH